MDTAWLAKVASVLNGVRTPLSLGGLTVIVLCVIYDRILGLGIWPQLKDYQAAALITSMVSYLFWLAIVAVVLGIAGYLIRPNPAGKKG